MVDLKERTGLSELVIGEIVKRIAKLPRVERAAIYGSRGRGDFRGGSDVDIALFGADVGYDDVNRLKRLLDDSPVVFPVDVVAVPALPATSKLRERIERDAVTLYERAA